MDKIAGLVAGQQLSKVSETVGFDKAFDQLEKLGDEKKAQLPPDQSEEAGAGKKGFLPEALKTSNMKIQDKLAARKAERDKFAAQMREQQGLPPAAPTDEGGVKTTASQAAGTITSGFSSVFSKVSGGVTTGVSTLKDGVTGVAQKVKTTVGGQSNEEPQPAELPHAPAPTPAVAPAPSAGTEGKPSSTLEQGGTRDFGADESDASEGTASKIKNMAQDVGEKVGQGLLRAGSFTKEGLSTLAEKSRPAMGKLGEGISAGGTKVLSGLSTGFSMGKSTMSSMLSGKSGSGPSNSGV